MTIDAADFRRAMSQFATGVTVVTTRDGHGRPQGLTVTAFCSVSLAPPLVLVCIERRPATRAAITASGVFGVSILAEGQQDVSRRFARGGSEKFRSEDVITGSHGILLVRGALAHVECRVSASHAAGDHVIYVGEVTALAVHAGRPLLYHRSHYRHLAEGAGHGA